MKTPHKDDLIFEQLRQLPPELNLEQVNQIIVELPNMPITPNNWFHFINLNTIFMSTIFILIISVGSFFLLPDTDESTPAKLTQVQDKLISENSEVPPATPPTITEREDELNQATIEESTTALIENKSPDLFTDNKAVELLSLGDKSIAPVQSPNTISPDYLSFDHTSETPIFSGCEVQFRFDGDMNKLKSDLLQSLLEDRIITSRRSKMQLSFMPEGIAINQRLLATDLQDEYRQMLAAYQIFPCDYRIIETSEAYVAAGDLTPEGFKGRVNGTIDLSVLNRQYAERFSDHSIKSKEQQRPIDPFHTLRVGGIAVVYLSNEDTEFARVKVSGMPAEDVITFQDNGVLTITTRGEHYGESIKVVVGSSMLSALKVSGAGELYTTNSINGNDLTISVEDSGAAWLEVNVDDLNIIRKGGDLTIKGQTNNRSIQNDDPTNRGTLWDEELFVRKDFGVTNNQSCANQLLVAKGDLKELKQELLDNLMQDGLINSSRSTVHMQLKNNMTINGRKMSTSESRKYLWILKEYNISPCEERFVAFNSSFIAVGDALSKGFRGVALGRKIILTSQYGEISLNLQNGYKTLNMVGWGSHLDLD